jgi:arginine decarboxylase
MSTARSEPGRAAGNDDQAAAPDVQAIAKIAHARGVVLVLDEGPHFGFHPDQPANALAHCSEIVTSSTHKLGGGLTQSGV